MPLPIVGAAVGAGVRFVGQRALQAGARQLTRQGLQTQAAKQTVLGATGLGITSARPAHAPGTQSPGANPAGQDRTQLSPEASAPQAPQSIPDFASTFNGAP